MSAAAPAPFVVGASRSGTTLLRMMLDAHPDLAIPPETNFGAVPDAFRTGGTAAAIDAIVATDQWQDCNISADDLRRRVAQVGVAGAGDILRSFYILYSERRGKRRWGDKSPYYVGGMVQIERLLPEARFVHVVRDGRDVSLSIMPLWFGPDTVTEAARWWSRTIESARTQARRLRHYREVRYEDLVSAPESTLCGLCEFLALAWDVSMLSYHAQADRRLAEETTDWLGPGRPVTRAERIGLHPLIGVPPQPSRIGRWRTEMSAADRRAFEADAGEALAQMGYEL